MLQAKPGCCCTETTVPDCLQDDVISATAGCCRGRAEKLLLRINRPTVATVVHVFSDPTSPLEECEGGCETSYTVTKVGGDALQVVYDYYGAFWKADVDAVNERPERTACGEVCADCCDTGFPLFVGCVCSEDALLSPHQKTVMTGDPYWNWLLDSICYDDSCADELLPEAAPTGSGCTPLTGKTDVFNHLLCVIRREWWYKASDCEGAFFPDPLAPPSGSPELQWDCFVPRFFVYACSGAPLFYFDLLDAVERGIISGGELCQVLEDLGLGKTPNQGLIQRLVDAGYLDVGDHRAAIVAELTELKARTGIVADAYAGCTVPACADLAFVGPVRKRFPTGLYVDCVADNATSIQPSLGACDVDPWGGGPYPDPEDGDYDDYVFWRERQYVYWHAAVGGWSWVCWDPGDEDAMIPDLARAFSENCASGDCLDVSGAPRDDDCSSGPWDGVDPVFGFPTCEVGCAGVGDEFDCAFPNLDCATQGDGSTCLNTAMAASCDGIHFIYSEVHYRPHAPTEDCPYDVEPYCQYVNHAYLFRLNVTGGDFDSSCPFACHLLETPVEISEALPNVEQSYLGYKEICDQISVGCLVAADLCCGSFCLDLGDPCSIVLTADACEPTIGIDEHEEQTPCLPT